MHITYTLFTTIQATTQSHLTGTNTGHISTAHSLFEVISFPCLKTRAQAVSISCFHG
uniref:Uncharacterized protein n=1 Tax=Setaria italica TaxID=4555 RepID=K3YXL4_SETIT